MSCNEKEQLEVSKTSEEKAMMFAEAKYTTSWIYDVPLPVGEIRPCQARYDATHATRL